MTTIGEWPVLEQLLPKGWGEAARTLGAFFRARYLKTPGEVLRLLLTHAAGDGGASADRGTAQRVASRAVGPEAWSGWSG